MGERGDWHFVRCVKHCIILTILVGGFLKKNVYGQLIELLSSYSLYIIGDVYEFNIDLLDKVVKICRKIKKINFY